MRTKASGYPSWPGVSDSTKGRIHWRRPTAILLFTLELCGRPYISGNGGGIGTPERFPCGKEIGSYVGLIPSEDCSADHQLLGHITKQGSSLLRFLLGEAARVATRCDADWKRRYVHLAMRRQRNIAK